MKTEKNLEGGGERMDIYYYNMDYNKFDMYQKSHYKRYIYAESFIENGDIVGDFACGSGYGTMILSERASKVIGVDINKEVIDEVKKRYIRSKKVDFIDGDILNLKYESFFDKIISFETVEHIKEDKILELFNIYNKALNINGLIIFSTPYNQKKCNGFHLTFNITENVIKNWMSNSGFEIIEFKFQNYQHHDLTDSLSYKDFIICLAKKIK